MRVSRRADATVGRAATGCRFMPRSVHRSSTFRLFNSSRYITTVEKSRQTERSQRGLRDERGTQFDGFYGHRVGTATPRNPLKILRAKGKFKKG